MTYTTEERAKMLADMRRTSNFFYGAAIQIGCHAFIEFTGLMNEYIKVCEEAEARGETEWPIANVHTGTHLRLKTHQVEYIREKLECIYGHEMFAHPLPNH